MKRDKHPEVILVCRNCGAVIYARRWSARLPASTIAKARLGLLVCPVCSSRLGKPTLRFLTLREFKEKCRVEGNRVEC